MPDSPDWFRDAALSALRYLALVFGGIAISLASWQLAGWDPFRVAGWYLAGTFWLAAWGRPSWIHETIRSAGLFELLPSGPLLTATLIAFGVLCATIALW